MKDRTPPLLWLGEPDCHRREFVGGKAANLSRLAATHRVPPGFCLTVAAFRAGEGTALGDGFHDAVEAAYETLAAQCGVPSPSVAVRSSAIDEDSGGASFAGQYESYLNVTGVEAVLQAINRCWASANSERIRAYRQQKGLEGAIPLAVLVQQMIPSDVSAVAFSANPVTNSADEIVINASWGLGESIVSGTVTPDTYIVDKSSLSLTSTNIADKQRMTVYVEAGTREVNVPRVLRTQPVLSESQALEMAQLALNLEQEMEWPVDLAFIGYALMEMRYFLETWIPGDGAAAVEAIVVLLIVGGWLRALFVAGDGRRGGLTALLALSALATVIALYDLQFVLFTPMPWPEQLMVVVMFVLAVLAMAALALQIWQLGGTG